MQQHVKQKHQSAQDDADDQDASGMMIMEMILKYLNGSRFNPKQKFTIDPVHLKIIQQYSSTQSQQKLQLLLNQANHYHDQICEHLRQCQHVKISPLSKLKLNSNFIDQQSGWSFINKLMDLSVFQSVSWLELNQCDVYALTGLELISHQLTHFAVTDSPTTTTATTATITNTSTSLANQSSNQTHTQGNSRNDDGGFMVGLMVDSAREGCSRRRGKMMAGQSMSSLNLDLTMGQGDYYQIEDHQWSCLEWLCLSGNGICKVNVSVMKAIGGTLSHLDLSRNVIDDCGFNAALQHCLNLVYLNMADNQITSVNCDLLIAMNKLEHLDLSANQLTQHSFVYNDKRVDGDGDQINGMHHIKELVLGKNQIGAVADGFRVLMSKMSRLQALKVDGNPLCKQSSNYRIELFRCLQMAAQLQIISHVKIDNQAATLMERMAMKMSASRLMNGGRVVAASSSASQSAMDRNVTGAAESATTQSLYVEQKEKLNTANIATASGRRMQRLNQSQQSKTHFNQLHSLQSDNDIQLVSNDQIDRDQSNDDTNDESGRAAVLVAEGSSSHGRTADSLQSSQAQLRLQRDADLLKQRIEQLKQSAGSGWLKEYAELQLQQQQTNPSKSSNIGSVKRSQSLHVMSDAKRIQSSPQYINEANYDKPIFGSVVDKQSALYVDNFRKAEENDNDDGDLHNELLPCNLKENAKQRYLYNIQIVVQSDARNSKSVQLQDCTIIINEDELVLQNDSHRESYRLKEIFNVDFIDEPEMMLTLELRVSKDLPVCRLSIRLSDLLDGSDLQSLAVTAAKLCDLNLKNGILMWVMHKISCVACSTVSQMPFVDQEHVILCSNCGSSLVAIDAGGEVKSGSECNSEDNFGYLQALSSGNTISPADFQAEADRLYEGDRAATEKMTSTDSLVDTSTMVYLKLKVLKSQESVLCWFPCSLYLLKDNGLRFKRSKYFGQSDIPQLIVPCFAMLTNQRFLIFTTDASSRILNVPQKLHNASTQLTICYVMQLQCIKAVTVGFGRQCLQLDLQFTHMTRQDDKFERQTRTLFAKQKSQGLLMKCCDSLFVSDIASQLTMLLFDRQNAMGMDLQSKNIVSYDCYHIVKPLLEVIVDQYQVQSLKDILASDVGTKSKLGLLSELCNCYGSGRLFDAQSEQYRDADLMYFESNFYCITYTDGNKIDSVAMFKYADVDVVKKLRLFDNATVYYGVCIVMKEQAKFEMYFPTIRNVESISKLFNV